MKHPLFPTFAALTALLGCRIQERKTDLLPAHDVEILRPVSTQTADGKIVAVGAASAPFIPKHPVALTGYGGVGRRFLPPVFQTGGALSWCKPFEKVDNPPLIKSAVFQLDQSNGPRQPLVLVSLDLVAVTSDITQKVHKVVGSVVEQSQPSFNNTLVLATHTHSGPAGLTENPVWGTFVCDQFNKALTDDYLATLKMVLQKAISKTEPVHLLETTRAQGASLFKSRFDGMNSADGIEFISFKSDTGRIPLGLIQLAAHPTTLGTRDLTLSADLVSPLETEFKKSFVADEVFLLQTTIGNMEANVRNDSVNQWSKSVANLVSSQTEKTTHTPTIAYKAGVIDLPEPSINWQACDAQFASVMVSLPILERLPRWAPFTTWKLADAHHLFLPGEWTTAASDQLVSHLQKTSSNKDTYKIFSLAHDYTAYHVTADNYAKKEIESCSSLYGRTALQGLTEQIRPL